MAEWISTVLRFIQLVSAAVLFGAPLFYLYADQTEGRWREKLIAVAFAAMAFGLMLSIMAQTSLLTGDSSSAVRLSDLSWYLTETKIGGFTLVRLALLGFYAVAAIAMPSNRRRHSALTVLGAAILLSFAWTGHGAEGGSLHLISDLVHLLMAGIWGGALLSLVLVIRAARRDQIPAALALNGLNAFSRIGFAVVALLAVSGIINALPALEDLHGLIESSYGATLGAKLLLFAGMLVLAAANRYRLAPRLAGALDNGPGQGAALAGLSRSILAEAALVILVLGLAAHLGSIEPPSGH